MITAENQTDTNVHHLITGKDSTLHRFDDPFLDCRYILFRDHAAHDFIDEFESLSSPMRLDLDHDMTVLPATAGLSRIFLFTLRRFANRFAISDLRFADVGFNTVFALQTVDDDFQV